MRSTSKKAKRNPTKRAVKMPPMEIGWREWISLPDLAVERIKAKIDTGAKSSALHAYDIREIVRDGQTYAEFALHPVQRKNMPVIKCVAPIVDKRVIRSSNGASEERTIVATTLKFGERSWTAEISLANRDEMGFRLLIGRDAIRKGVVVYPGKSFLLGK